MITSTEGRTCVPQWTQRKGFFFPHPFRDTHIILPSTEEMETEDKIHWPAQDNPTHNHHATAFFLCAQERGSVFFSFAVPSSRYMSDRLNCGSLSSQPMSTCRLMPGMKSWKCLSTQPQNTDSPILSCSSPCDSHDISTAAQIQAGYGNPGRFSC